MRFQYIFDKDDPDYKFKEEKLKRIRNFWIAFEKICLPHWISRREHDDAYQNFAIWVQKQLNLVDEKLIWEAHEIDASNFYLAISAGGDETRQVLARAVIDSAPEIEGWQFLSYLPIHESKELDSYCRGVAGFEIPKDLKVSLIDSGCMSFYLVFYSKRFADESIESIKQCNLIAKFALGEELFDRWVDSVLVSRPQSAISNFFDKVLGKPEQATFGLNELKSEVEFWVDSVLANLPKKYVSQCIKFDDDDSSPNWTVDLEAEDERHPGRKERLFYSMKNQSILFAVMNDTYFHSKSHSKLNEIFCYIKSMPFDHDSDYAQSKRSQFHLELDKELRNAELGCVLGIGSGLSSIYVDLVLRDVERAVPILQAVSRKFALPENTWLLFYDINLSEEWVGLNPHAKSPL